MKKWLFNSCNEEGISNFDAIVGGTTVVMGFILLIILAKVCGQCLKGNKSNENNYA